MANKKALPGTEEARKQSEETLAEQSAMKPVPSQEDADRIKLGEKVDTSEKQPDGPAAKAAEETDAANAEALRKAAGAEPNAAPYKTRETKGG